VTARHQQLAGLIPHLTLRRPPRDIVAIVGILFLIETAMAKVMVGGIRVGLDAGTYFIPAYSYLGDRLSSGQIPYWNPYQFSGTPFVADLQSGWTYLPAMGFFTALPIQLAVAGLLWWHVALAGFSIYAFARVLGIGAIGALAAATVYLFNGWFWVRVGCCPVETAVVAWLPVAFLGIELAMRTRRRWNRVCWWIFAAFGLSQIQAAWFGQGAYYSLLAIGGYLLYRSLIAPTEPESWAARFVTLGLHGAIVVLLAFALDAAAVIPRFEYHSVSSLAEGYQRLADVRGGVTLKEAATRLLGRSSYYAGCSALVLAAAGLVLGKRRLATPYFGVLALWAIVFSLQDRTPIHHIAYRLLPMFGDLQKNIPERTMIVFYFALAMLAGTAVDAIVRGQARTIVRLGALLPGVALIALAVWLKLSTPFIVNSALIVLGCAVVLIAMWSAPWVRQQRIILLPAFFILLLADLLPNGSLIINQGSAGRYEEKLDVATFVQPSPSARFLLAQERQNGPFRYFGYDPPRQNDQRTTVVLYRYHFLDPSKWGLLVNNRATFFGLEDAQGQNNPIQVGRFAEFIQALNGQGQDYHDANILPSGIDSPLLDLLNARYIIIPTEVSSKRKDFRQLLKEHRLVYEDADVRILENEQALPRAWIVHDARQTARGEALTLLAKGQVDPRRTALIETHPPEMGIPPPPTQDSATVERAEPERLVVRTESAAAGLLMVSQIAYPGWHAYVDGKPAPLLIADHTFQAVPIPAGAHQVEIRFESRTAMIGFAISAITIVGCGAVLLIAGWQIMRRRTEKDMRNGGRE
jgi:hypothetical protein